MRSIIDILPTIVELLQVSVPPIVQGKSLLPLMTKAESQVRPRAISMLDTFGEISSWTQDRHLIWNCRDKTFALYDHHADPSELTNLAGQQQAMVNDLRLTVLAFRAILFLIENYFQLEFYAF